MKLLIPLLAMVLSIPSFAADNDWRIVPGKRIGRIAIGMERAQVLRLLGAPNREDDLDYLNDNGQKLEYLNEKREGEYAGILRDDWTQPLPLTKGEDASRTMADFVSVYFRNLRVVQIDEDVPRFKTTDGLSCINTGIQWRKRCPKYAESFHKFYHQSQYGWPAAKIFTDYDDVVSDGVAWYFSVMGDLAPDPDPHSSVAVVVHEPGKPVIIDPDGGGRYIYKVRPNQLSTDQ